MPILSIPDGGLCNRMRSIESAIALGEYLHTPVTIYWRVNWQIRCRPQELFRMESLTEGRSIPVTIRVTGRLNPWRILWLAGCRIKSLRPIVRTLSKVASTLHCPFLLAENPEYRTTDQLLKQYFGTAETAKAQKKLLHARWIFYSGGWYGIDRSDFSRWKPTPELEHRIEEECRKIGDLSHALGVHIRRTDNEVAIRESPDELFEKRMQQEIAQDPSVHFYLATDSPSVKEKFSVLFGKRLTTPEGRLSRNDAEGMKQAVVELYTLARCRHIIATWYSTFSRTAAAIGGTELEVCRKNPEETFTLPIIPQ